ncbi:MAG: DMT family transporter [Rhodospirillales bacterium]
MSGGRSTLIATLIGGTAVLMWATLALFTTLTGDIPPFQLSAMAFAVAFAMCAVKWMFDGGTGIRALRQPAPVWLLGVGGLFGYHFFYFMALRNAPPVEAGLIAYLWPLLIVVCSALLPGEKLRWFHVAGGVTGLAGTVVLVLASNPDGLGPDPRFALGYAMAILCAATWTTYSLTSRRFGHVPTDAVGGFCLATSALSFVCHLVFETTVWPADGLFSGEMLAVAALGLGPVGAAFFTWDYGVKHGHIQALGASAYAAPLLSTILLIVFGQGVLSWQVAVACVAIVGGALLASTDLLRR